MAIVRRGIDADTAQRLVAAAVEKAREIGKAMSIAVVDEGGRLKAFHAMDGAGHPTVGVAQDKAWTASSFGLPTHAWYASITNDPPLLHGIVHTPRLTVFGGGYPVLEDGEMTGAIGVSGGHYSDDMEVARHALEAVGAPVA